MKILLHICCGVCAAGVVEKLKSEGNEVAGFFYNPNIEPKDEYEKRLAASKRVADECGIPLEEGPYDNTRWHGLVAGRELDPEGGKRCEICFRMRLEKTFEEMKKSGYDSFTTTITVGPMKNEKIVNAIGFEIGREKFIQRDYKKDDGFKKAVETAKKLGLYRQNYCGCLYSKRGEHAK